MEKVARIYGSAVLTSAGLLGSSEKRWSDRYADTPFHSKATTLESEQSSQRLIHAHQEVIRARERVADAEHQAEIAELESKFFSWKGKVGGETAKTAAVEKLACCRPCVESNEWSDAFKGSPFYKEALVLEAKDARREVARQKSCLEDRTAWDRDDKQRIARLELEADFMEWRVKNMGLDKTSSVLSRNLAAVLGIR